MENSAEVPAGQRAGRDRKGKAQKGTLKQRGELAEMGFMFKAAGLGFGVAKPWGDSERYDFILDNGHRLLRVQIDNRPAAEIVRGLEESFSVIKSGMERWSPAELVQEFARPTPNEAGNRPARSRQWIIWHLVEHDVHHGGEISFSLGMHGVPGLDL